MALTKEITMGSAQYGGGDLCTIPVTITLLQDAVAVRTKVVTVDKKTNQTLLDAVTKPNTVEKFQNVIDGLKAEIAVDAIPAADKLAARDALLAALNI